MDSSEEESEDETPRRLIAKTLRDMRTASLPLNRKKVVKRRSSLNLPRSSSAASTPAKSPKKAASSSITATPKRRSRQLATVDEKARTTNPPGTPKRLPPKSPPVSLEDFIFPRGRRHIVPGKYLRRPFDVESLAAGVAKRMETLKDDVDEKDTSDSNLRIRRLGFSAPKGRKLIRTYDAQQLAANVEKRVAENVTLTDDEDSKIGHSEMVKVASPEVKIPVKRVFGRRRGQDENRAIHHPFNQDELAKAIERRVQERDFGDSFSDSSAISTANNSVAAPTGRKSGRESLSSSGGKTLGDVKLDRGDSLGNNVSQSKVTQPETMEKSIDRFSSLRKSPRKSSHSPIVSEAHPTNEKSKIQTPAADKSRGSPKRNRNSSVSAKEVPVVNESGDDSEESSKSKPLASSAKAVASRRSSRRFASPDVAADESQSSPKRIGNSSVSAKKVPVINESGDDLEESSKSKPLASSAKAVSSRRSSRRFASPDVAADGSQSSPKRNRNSSVSAKKVPVVNESGDDSEESSKSKPLASSAKAVSSRRSSRRFASPDVAADGSQSSPKRNRNSSVSAKKVPVVNESGDDSEESSKSKPLASSAKAVSSRRSSRRFASPDVATDESQSSPKRIGNSSVSAKKVPVINESGDDLEESSKSKPLASSSKHNSKDYTEIRNYTSFNVSPRRSSRILASPDVYKLNVSDGDLKNSKKNVGTPAVSDISETPHKNSIGSAQKAQRQSPRKVKTADMTDFEGLRRHLITEKIYPGTPPAAKRPKSTRKSSVSAKKHGFSESDKDFEESATLKLVTPTADEARSQPKRMSFVSGKKLRIISDSEDDSGKFPKSRLTNTSSSKQNLIVINETTKNLVGSLGNVSRQSPRKDRSPGALMVGGKSKSETPVADEHPDSPIRPRKSISAKKVLAISESDGNVEAESSRKTSPVSNKTVPSENTTDSREPKPDLSGPKVVLERMNDSFIERATQDPYKADTSSVIGSQTISLKLDSSYQGVSSGIFEVIERPSDADSSDQSTDFVPGTGTLLQSYKSSLPSSPVPTLSTTPSPNQGAKLNDLSDIGEPNPDRHQSLLPDESRSRLSSKFPKKQQRSILDYIVDPEVEDNKSRDVRPNSPRTSTPNPAKKGRGSNIASTVNKSLINGSEGHRKSSIQNDQAESGKSSTYDTAEEVLESSEMILKKGITSVPKEVFEELEIVDEPLPKGPLYKGKVKKSSSLGASLRKSASSTSERGSLGAEAQSKKRRSSSTDEAPSAAKKPRVSEKRSSVLVQTKLTSTGSTKYSPKKSKTTKSKAKSVRPVVSRACVRSNAEHIIGRRLPPDTITAFLQESEDFIKTTMNDLASKSKGKKVSDKEILDYFISIGLCNDRDQFVEFVRDHAPLHVRAALIPCASAGNVVYPPMHLW